MTAIMIAGALALALLGATNASAEDTVKLAVGQRAGIFKKHGLTLELVYTQGAGETQQAVISGSVDLGIALTIVQTTIANLDIFFHHRRHYQNSNNKSLTARE